MCVPSKLWGLIIGSENDLRGSGHGRREGDDTGHTGVTQVTQVRHRSYRCGRGG